MNLDVMGKLRRTHYCAQLSLSNIGKTVCAAGFVQKRRDLGNLIFIDLRDRTGVLQLAFDGITAKDVFEKASGCRSEFVIMAQGEIRKRESINRDIPTGEIELFVTNLRVLSAAKTPPFEILDPVNAGEELRYSYRYLDLRRLEMQRILTLRHRVAKIARDYFNDNEFLEIETPALIRATPEGARDYLVPSRVHKGKCYALPQSPQLYKQLLMVSGFDRYMQIVRCFRDEDLRADRQPEFTQLDLEMSFVDVDDVLKINEGFISRLFKEVLDIEIQTPLPRIKYEEAMRRYGSDKPDTRFELELCDISDLLKDTEFRVFSGALETGSIRAVNAKGAAKIYSRKDIDNLTELVKTYKAKGLAWLKLGAGNETSSYEKFITPEERTAVREKTQAQPDDIIFIVADPDNDIVFNSLGALRLELGRKLGLIDPAIFKPLWVVDFPLFEYDEEDERLYARHHPFTSVADEDIEKMEADPAQCKAKAYDLVLHGYEIGGGSIRINNAQLQQQMFRVMGINEQEAAEKFGFLLDAFTYGVPPHGGMAYGLDRLVMILAGKDSIKDVIAFPKMQNANELMTNCPSVPTAEQLEELGISYIRKPDN
ncbi:MAG: aspartate--tRNA ligase [Oscillospiraceae bacterium]|nr:aspartate--tRNA ligase [Oscillospiraceae bacterium]